MIGAIAATVLFACSAIFGQRLSRMLGGIVANFWRLLLAVCCLGALCGLIFRDQFPSHPAVFWWFFLSGIIGFGFGDVALYLAYFRIGARLTMLLNLCLAPVFGAVGEYVWMGQQVSMPEIVCIVVIVAGIVLALKPDSQRPPHVKSGMLVTGICFAVVAGMGQGLGAVVSRYADSVGVLEGLEMQGMGGGLSQAFVRTLGGLTIALACFAGYQWGATRLRRAAHEAIDASSEPAKLPRKGRLSDRAKMRRANRFLPFWLTGAAITGPVLGVGCFQWALQSQKSAIVLAVTATSPLLVMLLARAVEKERTSLLALIGALISVSGVIAICLMKLPPDFWQQLNQVDAD